MKHSYLFLVSLLMAAFQANAEAPASYYDNCENRGGRSLLEALHSTISSHTTISYSGLWDLYKTSDIDENGKIWDMYSTKRWNPGKEQCGTYQHIGDCYNREHSFPKSWFNDASPMESDAFHIYPTDGKVNGQRSNNPFGECANGTYEKSYNGVKALGKLGKSTFEGYSGTVFEPDDEYKGDFARSYFYMAACYNNRISTWKSDMLAKNSYPVFSDWAIKLLMKWHRQDPVSQKETDRNEAVYARQHNRNPFIDHPEMAEYIWGDKTSERWSSKNDVATVINSPLDGSVISLGQMLPNMTATRTVTLKTTAAKEYVRLSTDKAVFTVSPATVSADAANKGTTITLSYTPTQEGSDAAVITITTGEATSHVSLTGICINRLPVNGAKDVTSESFTATWAYVGDDINGNYTLDVRLENGPSVDGYPRTVDARAQEYEVDGLEPSTTYIYSLSSLTRSSDDVTVTTAEALPAIHFLYDGDLVFSAAPGEPSEAEELIIDIDNIDTDFTVSVSEPFEISLDKARWETSLTLTPDDSRLYMRLYSDVAGTFRTSVTAVCGSYFTDDASVSGTVAAEADFLEDFENPGLGTYSPQEYLGTACRWNLNDAGFWSDKAYAGSRALRGGKSGKGLVEMAEDRTSGIGTVSFYAHKWPNDENTVMALEYSTDGGESWTEAGHTTFETNEYSRYTVTVNVPGTVRIRLHQTGGKRFLIDNIEMTRRTSGLDKPDDMHHRWDAFGRDGALLVEVKDAEGLDVTVYTLDGMTIFSNRLPQGVHTIATNAAGKFFIVTAGTTARPVPVR